MASPLKWNSAGNAKWNSAGALWNGIAVSNKSMNTIKAIIDFSDYTATGLGPVATHIHTKMTANAATYGTPVIAMAALQTLITAHNAAQAAKASGARADTIAANVAREELEDALGELGGYVNGVAKGDAVLVELSGFPSYDTAHTAADTGPPAAPTNVRLKHGGVVGTIKVRHKPDRQPSTNEVQITSGDPTVEAGWHTVGLFKSGKATLTGLTAGTCVWVRIRTVGLNGVMGAWSDPAEIRVV